jgi:hypothetical protein
MVKPVGGGGRVLLRAAFANAVNGATPSRGPAWPQGVTMSDEFDPYLKWLGIPPKFQPPTHYRLLGLEAFESDPDAIENAADRQMAHLRTFRNGKRVELAERMLNEIAEAKVCLLNDEKKTDYDAKLRAIESKRKAAEAKQNGHARSAKHAVARDEAAPSPVRKMPSPPAVAPPAVAAPLATPVAIASEPAPSPNFVGTARGSASVRRQQKTPWIAIAVIGAIGLGVLAVAAIVLPSLLQPPPEVATTAADDPPAATNTNNASSTSTTGGDTGTSTAVKSPPGTTEANPPATTGDDDDDSSGSTSPRTDNPRGPWRGGDRPRPSRDPRNPRPSDPSRDPSGNETPQNNEGDENDGENDDEPEGENPAPLPGTAEDGNDDTDEPPTQIVERIAAPAAEQQKEIETRLRTLYKFAAASSPAEFVELAKKLVADAAETRDSPNDQFVMYRVAAETAAQNADVATAMAAVDALDANFEVDNIPLRLKLVEQAAKSSAPPAERAQALRDALPVLDAALADNKFAEIDTLTTQLLASARRLKDTELSTALIERRKSALALKKQYDKAVAALDTLKTNPDDPAANGIVGEFWAYVKDNWEKGLPHLAKGNDAAQADAAKQELAQNDDASAIPGEEIAKLADAWFAVAGKQDSPAKQNLLRHAQKLYDKALPDVAGLTKTSVETQLVEIEKLLAAAGSTGMPASVSRMAHITASCDSSFEMYINGEYVTRGDREEISDLDRELKSGDVILVFVSNLRRERGFACVIKFEDSKTIVTGQANAWYQYTPASAQLWYDPRGVAAIAAPQLGDGDRHQRIEEQTGIRSQSIWGNNQFRSYLVLRVP